MELNPAWMDPTMDFFLRRQEYMNRETRLFVAREAGSFLMRNPLVEIFVLLKFENLSGTAPVSKRKKAKTASKGKFQANLMVPMKIRVNEYS